jgi:O-antigen/teichoic acid export membrane protein
LRLGKFKDISLIGSAEIMGTAISSIFWLFLASQIPPEDYGEIFYFLGIVGMTAAFVLIGTQNAITVYSSKNIKIESTLYFISLLLGIVASFTIMVIFYRVDVIFLLFGYIINTLSMGELLGKKNFLSYSKYILIQKILTLSLGLLFFLIFDIDGIIFALAISYIFFVIIIVNRFRKTKINFSLFKDRSKFILGNYLIEIITKSNTHLNKFIIVPLLGFAILGNFSLAMQLVNIGLIFTLIVFKYTISYDAQGQENKKLKKITLFVSIGIALLGAAVAPTVIPIFFIDYVDVVGIVQIAIFGIIPLTITKLYASKLLGQENSKQILYSKIISMVSFIIAIMILGPIYGVIGVAIGYLFSTILEAICLIPKNQIIKR